MVGTVDEWCIARIQKEAFVAKNLEIFLKGLNKTTKNLSQDSCCSTPDSNQEIAE